MVAALHIAKGDSFPIPNHSSIPSPIECATDDQWSRFVAAMTVQGLGDVSESGGLGWFAMRPKRLEDLGVMTNLRRVRTATGRHVFEGDFILPVTETRFLTSPVIQFNILVKSVASHLRAIPSLPDGVSLSGALALLHKSTGGLRSWTEGRLFDDTAILFTRANAIF